MDTSTAPPSISERRPLPLRAALMCAGVLVLLALVTVPAREPLYLLLARPAAASAAGPVIGAAAEVGLVILAAVTGVLAVWSWVRDRRGFWTLASAGVGVVGSYLLSEGVKLLVVEPRPCRVMDLETVLSCPVAGDWSWPSNHSVIAASFAAACVLAAPRTAWFLVPIALLVAASRVGAGVHYVHDVASGLALGVLLVVVAVLALHPVAMRLSRGATARSSPGQPPSRR